MRPAYTSARQEGKLAYFFYLMYNATCNIAYCARSNLDEEYVVFVAQLRDLWPRKSIHVQRVVVDVQSVRTDSDVNVDKFGILTATVSSPQYIPETSPTYSTSLIKRWLVGFSLMALSTQSRSYRTFRVIIRVKKLNFNTC